MGRIIGSVVVGYLIMFVAIFVLFGGAYLLLGANGSFQPGSWDASGLWLALSVVLGIVAATVGGYVCAAMAKNIRGPQVLVAVVVILGLLFAIPALTGAGGAAAGVRPDTVGLFDAMQNARQPMWLVLLNPVLGAVGVLIGARLRLSGAPPAST